MKNIIYINIFLLLLITNFNTHIINEIDLININIKTKKNIPNKYYNEIYYLLDIKYSYFIKKIHRLDEDFLLRFLQKETETIDPKSNKNLLIKKSSNELRNIFIILKTILKTIKNNFNSLLNLEALEKFIIFISQELENSKSIQYAFHKGIYLMTGNESYYNELNSAKINKLQWDNKLLEDSSLITLMWILYIYEDVSNIFSNINKSNDISNEEIFIYTYPLYINSLNKTFDKIRLHQTLMTYFSPFLMTHEGLVHLINKEKYNKAVNEDMAFHLIKEQKIKLMELLLDDNNKKFLNKITSIMKQIADYSSQLITLRQGKSDNHWIYSFFDIQDLPLESYLRQYIPSYWFCDGVNSHKILYNANSSYLFIESSIAKSILTIWHKYNMEPLNKNIHNGFLDNVVFPFVPLAGLWPLSSFNKKEFEKIVRQDPRSNNDESVKEKFWLNQRIYTFEDRIHQYKNWPGYLGKAVNAFSATPYILGTSVHLASTLYDTIGKYYSIKSILSQVKGIKNHYKYFFCLKKMILYSKQLMNVLFQLYKENNINEEYIIPEIIQMKNIFKKNSKNGLLNKILSWTNKNVNLIFNSIYNFFVPGSMAHFYFKELYESIEIDILNNYIGSIDFLLTKLKLLDLNKRYPELSFSIPILLDPSDNKKAILKATNMWLPSLRGHPVNNSIELEKNNRNMMIVSPVAGGKTVLLSTILTQLYLANMGITASEKLEYTYFTNIIDHMHHEYIIGDGLSQHLAERRSMQSVKNIANNDHDNDKYIIIIDEIYKGTTPKLAIKEALIDLPPILKKENIITIITTHFEEITSITKIKEYAIDLYYLLVNYVAGIFTKTHKLHKDDENNWWIRDDELGLKYQLSQDHKL